MPIREYECETCGKVFEVLERTAGSPKAQNCPACGGNKVQQRLSTFASQVSADGGCGTSSGGG